MFKKLIRKEDIVCQKKKKINQHEEEEAHRRLWRLDVLQYLLESLVAEGGLEIAMATGNKQGWYGRAFSLRIFFHSPPSLCSLCVSLSFPPRPTPKRIYH